MGDSLVGSTFQQVTSWQRLGHRHSGGQATRHLCVGTYVDRAFRDRVIRQVHNDSRRRVAPSYGFDLVPVVRHAWRSWWIEVGRMAATVASLLGGLLLGTWLAVVLAVGFVAACNMLRRSAHVFRLQIVAVADRWFERRSHTETQETARSLRAEKRRLEGHLATSLVVSLVIASLASAGGWSLSLGDAVTPMAAIVGLLGTWAAVAGAVRQVQLNSIHGATSLRPGRLSRREEDIDEQQSHPCAIYRRPGGFDDIDPFETLRLPEDDDLASPFIGSGLQVNRWVTPLVVQLLRRGSENLEQREYATPPFEAHQLLDRVRRALRLLGEDSGPHRLGGLEVRDRLYVAETDVSSDRTLLHGPPDQEALRKAVDDPGSQVHHFLETTVSLAGGELVTTVFLRIGVRARNLSLDVATCALTRTLRRYQVIDDFAEHGRGAVLRSAARSVFDLPVELPRLWRLLEAPLLLVRAWSAGKDRTLVPRRGVHIGTRVAVREHAAEPWANTQLETSWIYGHMKIIEQRILKTTEGFLKDHDIDTSMFEKQATTIINSGVLTMGGRTEVKQSAVGDGAQVNGPIGLDDAEEADQ